MRAIADPDRALGQGLASIRKQYQVPETFPTEVLAAAEEAGRRAPTEHMDRTSLPFVSLDPASSTDLDQAFTIERSGTDLLLHYAIADVAWFVDTGGLIEQEAWRRGATQYFPDGRAGLYPPVLSENAASLLPGGPRPAVIFTVRVDSNGEVALDSAERATIQNKAKLAYDTVTDPELPSDFSELARRIQSAESRRGAARINPPAQEIASIGNGRYELLFQPPLESEVRNAALSLATNLAIADRLQAHHTGLFRVMAEPDAGSLRRLRFTARALGIQWPAEMPLPELERKLNPADARDATLMLAIQRASQGAAYVPFQVGKVPWHAAVAATYTHATAPLRRLADRYVVEATLAIANGQAVSPAVTDAFEKLPAVMARADALGSQIERAAIELAEAVLLAGREGETFLAVATEVDHRGARIQLCDLPVVARVADSDIKPGQSVQVTLVKADRESRTIVFQAAAG